MIRTLPRWDYQPPAKAGPWLVGAAILLVPLVWALGFAIQPVDVASVVKGGVTYTLRTSPAWVDIVGITAPLAVLAGLILSGRISRYDVGLTLGRFRVSAFWIVTGIAVDGAIRLVVLGVLLVVARLTPWLPPRALEPEILYGIGLLGPWMWHDCVVGPVREELIARGITVPALEWVGGARLAVIGSAVVWAASHYRVHSLGPMLFLAVWGMVLAWVFLRTRSLVVVILLHAAGNLFAVLKDVTLLCCPEFVGKLFGAN